MSGKRLNWKYEDTSHGSSGTMMCAACNKKIEAGEYRFRIKTRGGDWGYVTEHRACSSDDPNWALLDSQRRAGRDRLVALSEACKAFRDKWGVDELNDYIITDEQP